MSARRARKEESNVKRIAIVFFWLAIILTILPVPATAATQRKVAVIELLNQAGVTDQEAAYLTDKVRDAASRTLDRDNFLVITRESIQELLPPDMKLENCSDAKCEVEIGRRIGADYIVTGEILKFAGELRVNLKSLHSQSAAFVGSEAAAGKSLTELERSIDAAATALFGKVMIHANVRRSGAPVTAAGGVIDNTPVNRWELPPDQSMVVEFVSDPSGAVVLANNELLCQSTPCSKLLPIGPIRIAMKKERYFPRENTVTVQKNLARLEWKLTPNFGWLSVRSTPPALTVLVNGKVQGNTPIDGLELDPGSYRVVVSDPRYYEKGEEIVLQPGQRKTIDVEMVPREGGLRVTAKDKAGNDLKGKVILDGTEIGAAPGVFKVVVGTHQVGVSTDVGSWADTVVVKEGLTENVVAEVTPEATPPRPTTVGKRTTKGSSKSDNRVGVTFLGCYLSPGEKDLSLEIDKEKTKVPDGFRVTDKYEAQEDDLFSYNAGGGIDIYYLWDHFELGLLVDLQQGQWENTGNGVEVTDSLVIEVGAILGGQYRWRYVGLGGDVIPYYFGYSYKAKYKLVNYSASNGSVYNDKTITLAYSANRIGMYLRPRLAIYPISTAAPTAPYIALDGLFDVLDIPRGGVMLGVGLLL
jgi:TolB-like protein